MDSYPFLPEVIDVLYHRWGSYHTFQRTRGVLRLLALVIESLRDKNIPYISLSDFDLENPEIRQELIKHIGQEYNSVIAQDITAKDSGSKKVDLSLSGSYKGLKLGTRTATSIFMYSFSAGTEKGATLTEIKRAATVDEIPSSIISDLLEQMKNKLFYFQIINDKYLFTNQPNINRILITKMENISDEEILEMERELLKKNIDGDKLKVFIWEENSANIPDTEELKLIILKEKREYIMESIIKDKGSNPRINCNTIFFLYPMENERRNFEEQIRKYKAINLIKNDKTITLRDDQKKQLESELKKIEQSLNEALRRLYRLVAIPQKDNNFKEDDLGVPTYGSEKDLDSEVYEKLKNNGDILEKILPLFIKEKYLKQREYINVEQLANSFYRNLGEPRPINRTIIQQGICEGVKKGLFGIGEMHLDQVKVNYFEEEPEISFGVNEIIIKAELFKKTKEEGCGISSVKSPIEETKIEPEKPHHIPVRQKVSLKFDVPRGKVNDIMRIVNYLQEKFNSITFEIEAKDGEISESDYENKVEETLNQLGIVLKDEENC